MSQNANNTLVPARTYVYLAPVGSTAPADESATLDTAWKEVGHTTTDSLSFATDAQFENIKSAQSNYPIREYLTEESASLSVDLLEFSGANFKSVYGGGQIVEVGTTGSGHFKFSPPSGTRTEVSAIIEVRDGSKVYRYVFPKVIQREGVESQLHKGASNTLPLRLSVVGADGVDPWYLLTNDPAFDPAP